MLKGLMKMGVEPICVVPTAPSQDYEQLLRNMGIPVYRSCYRFCAWPHSKTWKQKALFLPRLFARLCVNLWTECRLYHILRHENISIVHTNVSVISIGYNLSRLLHIPHIFHVREYADRVQIRHFPTKHSFHKKLTTPQSYSIFITRDLLQYYRMEQCSTACVIYNGISDVKKDFPQGQRQSYFLFVGNISRPKGIDQLLDAYCRYAVETNEPFPLYIAGQFSDSQLYEQLMRQVNEYKLQDKVAFLGSRTDAEALMSQACAVIVSSLSEGFGRVMAEAMFNGTLVIGRNTSGTKEQMDNGLRQTGQEIALRYDTTEELADRLQQVAEGFADFEAMRQRAFRVVNELYTHEEHARRVFDFYKEILENESRHITHHME